MAKNADALDDDDKEALECRRILAQCEKIEFQNLVERGRFTANDVIRDHGLRVGHATRTSLLRLKADAPTWEGLPAAEIEGRVSNLIELICGDLHDALGKLYGSASPA